MSNENVLLMSLVPQEKDLLSFVVLCYVVFSYSNCEDESQKEILGLLCDSLTFPSMS